MDTRRSRIAAGTCAVLLISPACSSREDAVSEPGANQGSDEGRATTQSRLSESGLYRVSLRPKDREAPLGRIHDWVLHLETAGGEAFMPPRLAFSGGMPQHGHGFDTQPRVTRALGDGDFLVEGVKFHMAGDWRIRVEFVGPAGADVAIFHVQVEP